MKNNEMRFSLESLENRKKKVKEQAIYLCLKVTLLRRETCKEENQQPLNDLSWTGAKVNSACSFKHPDTQSTKNSYTMSSISPLSRETQNGLSISNNVWNILNYGLSLTWCFPSMNKILGLISNLIETGHSGVFLKF